MTLNKGDIVKFLGYNPEELTPDPPTFEPGDVLEVVQVGSVVSEEELIAVRQADGRKDMVWPEEVAVI